MKSRLRLALAPLARLDRDSVLAFALLDRDGRLLRGAELPLHAIAAQHRADSVQVILHPGDAIVATTTIPPVSGRHAHAAVLSSIEPMTLSDPQDLCIAHGPRAPDGSVTVAWTDRHALQRAWALLAEAGLNVTAIVAHPLAIPAADPNPDRPLALPADARWQADLPRWSLARAELRPAAGNRRWRSALRWSAAAALVWIAGLQIHAAQLRTQTQALRQGMEQTLRAAFPHIPVIIDPVRQAEGERNALRLARGAAADDDFLPLALATAMTLTFAENHVGALHYRNGELLLTLSEGYAPPANEAALKQAAAANALALERDATQAHTWVIRRATAGNGTEGRP